MAAAGSFCAAAAADANAAASDTPEDRLRALLSDRRSLRLVRGDEQLEATYWSADAGYNRDEYLNICWLLRDMQADRVFPMNHGLLDVLCGVQTWLARTGVDAPLRDSLRLSDAEDEQANRRCSARLAPYRRTRGGYQRDGRIELKLAGMASVLGHGGTGLYPGRNFVHVDTGDERIWIDRPRKKS